MTRSGPFNVALLGYGYAGRVFHAPLIAATDGLTLHSIVSSQNAAAEDFPSAHVVDRARALADPDIDAVVIATPNDTHAALACEALAAGKHVLVDKPFAVTADEAQRIVAAAEHADRIASVFQNRRWDADFLTVRGLIEAGELGRITEFHSHFDRFRPQVRDRWRESDAPGAGLWFDLGPHLLDQALQLFGSPQAIQADIATQREHARSDDWFDVVLHYPRMRAVLHAGSLVADARLRFAVHGDRGSFVKQGLDTQEDALRAGRHPGGGDWGLDPQDGSLTRVDDDGHTHVATVTSERGDYRCCYAQWRDAIAGIAPPPVSAAQALQLMELLELAVRSARLGQRLDVAATA
jgi:predicted dehydrogenase